MAVAMSLSSVNSRLIDLRMYGSHSLAYASLQSGLDYFYHPDFKGFIAYKKVNGYDFVLGGPIVAVQDREQALKLFTQHHPKAIFCQIDMHIASILAEMDYSVHGFGEESLIMLDDFKVTWRIRPDLKRWLSSYSRLNFRLEEIDCDHIYLKVLNQEWLKGKKRELSFMARPLGLSHSKDVLAFILYRADEPLGFVTFDPIYANEQIIRYELQHWRVLPRSPKGAMDYMLTKALMMMKDNGVGLVSLGVSPLFNRDQDSYGGRFWIDQLLTIFGKTSWFYNFKGLGVHKSIYKGISKNTYLAFPKACSLKGLLGLLKVNCLV